MVKSILYVFLTVVLYEYIALCSDSKSCEAPYEKSLDLKIKLKKNGSSNWFPSFAAKKYTNNGTEILEIDLEHSVKKCGPHDLHQVTASVRDESDINNTNNESSDSKDVAEGYMCRRKVGFGKNGNRLFMTKNGAYSNVMSLHPLKKNEMFEATLDWQDGLWFFVVGITNQSATDMMNPHWIDDNRPGTSIWYGFVPHGERADVFYRDESPFFFARGERFGLMVRNNGALHFYSDGADLGPRAFNITDSMHVFIELLHNTGKGLTIEE